MNVIDTVRALRAEIANWRRQGARVGLVPTMGALHEGHLSLVRETRKRADRVVVSIFVNPKQFAPHEDFDRYPRAFEADAEKLASTSVVDTIFAPGMDEMYPDGFSTSIHVGGPTAGLETDFRPHFFSGVATVVAKLLLVAMPDIATFGEKDYQQLLTVRRLARDLGLPTEIFGAPIVREPDGLAMSSRNAYLDPRQRAIAGKLNVVLRDVGVAVRAGSTIEAAEKRAAGRMLEDGFDAVDYVSVRDAETLATIKTLSLPARVLAAVRIGKTRLIDNMAV